MVEDAGAPEMSGRKVPCVPPRLLWRQLDDGAVIVSPEEGQVLVLNEVGAAIWQLVDGRRDLRTIERELVAAYDVSAQKARADLRAFIENLVARELIAWR